MKDAVTELRKAMSKLDCAIPDYVFDSDEGSEIAQCISDVWDEIDKVERLCNSYRKELESL